MAIAKRLRWAWLAALWEGNCVTIMKLLREPHGQELVGLWPDEAEAQTIGDGWKGCNAIHVAVKHGCRELLINIIGMLRGDLHADVNGELPDPDPREKLREMILAFEGNCELDAIGIAVVNGDRSITEILALALLNCGCNPYGAKLGLTLFGYLSSTEKFNFDLEQEVQNAEDLTMVERIKKVTSDALESMDEAARGEVKEFFEAHCEFNFLDMNTFLVHALASYRNRVLTGYDNWNIYAPEYSRVQKNHLSDCSMECWKRLAGSADLLKYVFRLKDSRGRTPLHVAVDHDSVKDFLKSLRSAKVAGLGTIEDMDYELQGECFNARDAAGRTALHRAAAAVNVPLSVIELIRSKATDLNAGFQLDEACRGWCLDISKVSKRNGFGSWLPCSPSLNTGAPERTFPVTALHLAIFNPRGSQILGMLITWGRGESELRLREDHLVSLRSLQPYAMWQADVHIGSIAPFGLAALAGNLSCLQLLIPLQGYEFADDGGRRRREETSIGLIPGLILAAAVADSMVVETICSSSLFEPTAIDFAFEPTAIDLAFRPLSLRSITPSTTIDAAVRGWQAVSEIRKHLFHIAHCQDGFFKTANSTSDGKVVHLDQYHRRACVNFVLQAGENIWSNNGEAPVPSLITSPEFHAWWSERVDREIQEMKTTLNTASNAISVTAALVATASYVGPLQPPRGYMDNYVQVEELSIKLFVIFDTLAFYMALAAIVLAMIPSLPVSNQSVKLERKRARDSVIIAVSFLIVSIVCILMAFASSSIAVISNDGSWNHGGLTLSTLSIGGFICLGALLLFVKRLNLIKLSPGKYNTILGFLAYYLGAIFLVPLGIIELTVLQNGHVALDRYDNYFTWIEHHL